MSKKTRFWQTFSWKNALLLPLSGLFWLIVWLKRFLYQQGWKKSYSPPVPTIVIGNIYVGGTGKTPFLIFLIEALQLAGFHPGVVSRGYGANIKNQVHVTTTEDVLSPELFGDEPALIFQRTRVPLACAPNRVHAAKTLLATHPHINVILSDDGLQHLALARDLEILIEDERGIGNGFLLPAGPLREPAIKREQVAWRIQNQGSKHFTQVLINHRFNHQLQMRIAGINIRPLHSSLGSIPSYSQLSDFQTHTLAAVCAIGNPQRFLETLSRHGLNITETCFLPDHYAYQDNPFSRLQADFIFITEKDAIKCKHILDSRIWVLSIDLELSSPFFLEQLIGWLNEHKTT